MRQLLIYLSVSLLCGTASAQGFDYCGTRPDPVKDFATAGLCADQRRSERADRDRRDREERDRSPSRASGAASVGSERPTVDAAVESDEDRQRKAADQEARREQAAEAERQRVIAETEAIERRLRDGTARYLELMTHARPLSAAGKFSESLAALEKASQTLHVGDSYEVWRLISEAQAALGDYGSAQHSIETLISLMRFDGKATEAEQWSTLRQKYQGLALAEEKKRARAQDSADPFELAQRQALVAETRKKLGHSAEDPEFVKLQKMTEEKRQKVVSSAAATLKRVIPKVNAAYQNEINPMREDAVRVVAQNAEDGRRNRLALQLAGCEAGDIDDCVYIAEVVAYSPADPGGIGDAVLTILRVSCLEGTEGSCIELIWFLDGTRAYNRGQWRPTANLDAALGAALVACELDAGMCWEPAQYLSGYFPSWKHPDLDRALLFAELSCRKERALKTVSPVVGCRMSDDLIREQQRRTPPPR